MNNATFPEIRKAEPEPGDALAERRERLLRHLARLLPDPRQEAAFRAAMVREPAAAVRLNPLIPASQQLRSGLRLRATPVPWCDDAFVLAASERQCGRTLEHALGAVYIQAKATTLAVEALAPRPGERVLDMAAAPGGKATQIAARLRNTGLLVANEPRRRRVPALVGNLERCGVHCAVVTRAPGTVLARHFHNYFDRVLLDAPCSGDGILCKDQNMLRYWSADDAERKSREQTGLLRAAFHTLRPGGTLVYSTCSLSTEENEEVLQGLLRRYGELVALLPVDGLEDRGQLAPAIARQYPDAFRHTVRIWPHRHDTEGAFIARIRKTGPTEWRQRTERQNPGSGPDVPTPGEAGRGGGGVDASLTGPASLETPTPEGDPGDAGRRYIEDRWGLALPLPADHEFAQAGRDLLLRPSASSALMRELGEAGVRAGMRVASIHKGHYYLTQQSIALWSHLMSSPPSVSLDWTQTRALFRNEAVQLASHPAPGEVICWHGSWPVCRGIVRADSSFESFVPRSLRGLELRRFTDEPSPGRSTE